MKFFLCRKGKRANRLEFRAIPYGFGCFFGAKHNKIEEN